MLRRKSQLFVSEGLGSEIMTLAVDGYKICSKCKTKKSVLEFYKQHDKSDGFECQCKVCSLIRKKEYKLRNREKVLASLREYNKTPKARESNKRYMKTDVGRLNGINSIYRRRSKLKIGRHDFSNSDLQLLLALQGGKCACCHQEFSETRKLERDHIKPISKGGETTLENIQLLCRSCNAKKHDKEIRYAPELHTYFAGWT